MPDTPLELRMDPRASWMLFFRQWLRNPRAVASVAPSGRELGRRMVAAIPDNAQRVVELGAGTGAITRALLEHGIQSANLLVVEMNPELHDLLLRQFPDAHVVAADARQLDNVIAAGYPTFAEGGVDAVLSSLGLLAMPKSLQHDIVDAAFKVMRTGGVFVQYTYGTRAPLNDDVRADLGLHCTRTGTAWRNLPPARVFTYSRP